MSKKPTLTIRYPEASEPAGEADSDIEPGLLNDIEDQTEGAKE